MNFADPSLPWDQPPTANVGDVDLVRLQQLAGRMVGQPLCSATGDALPLVIGLCGTLGAGKTRLVQEICRAAGVDVTEVTSPTFTLVQSYSTATGILHHLDAYRIADVDEFWQLGMDDWWWEPGCRTFVEWADRVVAEMPAETIWVRMTIDDTPVVTESQDQSSAPRTLAFWGADPIRCDWIRQVTNL